MKAPHRKTISQLYAMSGNRCAYPKCRTAIFADGTNLGEICHIAAQNIRGPRYDATQNPAERQGYDNLILLCRHHHKRVDDLPDTYTCEVLAKMKRDHEAKCGRPEESSDLFIAKRLIDDLEGRLVIVAGDGGHVTVQTKRATYVKAPLAGSIGADPDAYRYTRYLIDRYHEFKKADHTLGEPVKYAVLYAAIKREFRTKWDHIPFEKFSALSTYLQKRIDGTILGRKQKARGHTNYDSWEVYRAR